MSSTQAPEHTCWSYDDGRVFDAFARRFIHAGLAAGEQVWYVPSGVPSDLLPAGWEPQHPDAFQMLSPDETYAADQAIDPAAQIDAYVTATDKALAAGFTGLRVVADATALVRSAAQLDAFARYEYEIGRYMRTAPMRGLCVYNRAELGDDTVAQLACLHRRTNAVDVPFQLYAGPTRDTAVLTGELDAAGEELFRIALRRADLRPVGGRIVLHAEGLQFIDNRSLHLVQRYAREREAVAVFRTRLSTVAPMVEVLRMTHIRVETLG